MKAAPSHFLVSGPVSISFPYLRRYCALHLSFLMCETSSSFLFLFSFPIPMERCRFGGFSARGKSGRVRGIVLALANSLAFG